MVSFVQRFVFFLSIISVIFIPSFVSAQSVFQFSDGDSFPSWGRLSIEDMKEKGIMTGFADGSFRPDVFLNRVEALAVLLRIKGIDYTQENGNGGDFYDVQPHEWYTKIVQSGVRQGWIKGFSDGSFRPAQSVTKAEFAVMVQRAFSLTRQSDDAFDDVPPESWFSQAVSSLAANELIRQRGTSFFPHEYVSRAEAAWILSSITRMPRLMGTSQSMDLSGALRRDTRRVALRPRDFNPYKQGIESTAKQIRLQPMKASENPIILHRTDDWVSVGRIQVQNLFDTRSQLNMIEMKLRFDASNIGPADNFDIRLSIDNKEYIETFNTTGSVLFTGISLWLDADEESEISVSLRPKENAYYFGGVGDGWLSMFRAEGVTYSDFVSAQKSDKGFVFASVKLEEGHIGHITFVPSE